jgi:hypothetical protein
VAQRAGEGLGRTGQGGQHPGHRRHRPDRAKPLLTLGEAAVLVVGPRACGKTTTTRRRCHSILRLDVPAQAAVVRADPDAALRDLSEPILIDEWQLVPDILQLVRTTVLSSAMHGPVGDQVQASRS